MYWTLELASHLEDAPWPATKDELIDYAMPGIPLIMPGERFTTDSIVDYLKFARDTDDRFPGFEADIHGPRHETDRQGRKTWFVDCVKKG